MIHGYDEDFEDDFEDDEEESAEELKFRRARRLSLKKSKGASREDEGPRIKGPKMKHKRLRIRADSYDPDDFEDFGDDFADEDYR